MLQMTVEYHLQSEIEKLTLFVSLKREKKLRKTRTVKRIFDDTKT